MNTSQARHSKSIARKIRMNAESMALSMGAIEGEDLSDTPLEVVKALFHDLDGYWRNIRSVLTDMLEELDEQ